MKKKPMKYFLDHPQIKRSKSWGNGAVPHDWEAGEKPADRAAHQTSKAMNRFKKTGSSDFKGKKHMAKVSEAGQVEQSQKKQRNSLTSKPNKPVYSKVSGLGEKQLKDKVK